MRESKRLLPMPLFIFIIFFFLSITSTSADDASVMQKLANLLNPTPKGWSTTSDPCSSTWPGVGCKSGRVISINLQSQSLSGSLPSDLNTLSQLQTLALQRNQLSGDLPTLSSLSNLQSVYLDTNNFTAMPPTFFSGLTSLTTFSINQNPQLASWVIPDDLSKSATLAQFEASNAGVTGTIPSFFGSLSSLRDLRLSYNNLSGGIPSSFSGSLIQNLWLNNQQLSGPIDVLGSMTQLSQVWLQANAFSGPVPDLSNCTSLFDLQLRDNQLTGVIPSSIVDLPKLVNVSFGNNMLQGPYPGFKSGVTVADSANSKNGFCNSSPGPCDSRVTVLLEVEGAFGYPAKLANVWKGNDPCNGWSFVTCQNSNVDRLNIANLQLGGTISPAIVNLTSLEVLILSDNNLTGSIPESLTSLSQLQTIDVSNNNLTGKIPVFPKNVNVITTGNPYIGSNSTSGGGSSGSGSSGSGSSSGGGSSGISKSIRNIIIIAAVVCVFALVIAYVFVRRLRKSKRIPLNRVETMKLTAVGPSSNGETTSGQTSIGNSGHSDVQVFESGSLIISIQDLRLGTDNFNNANIVGRGGFGVVYKGKLPDGRLIAVKRMESSAVSSKGMNEFQAEIAVLTKVRHRHLVALLGYCINGNENLLVYEYMPQGTLGQHLFDWRENNYEALTWKQRLTIALDVGRGIEYLHSLAQKSFIHRDLKPSNILLGDDMRAKVSDFGLVKLAPEGKSCVETRLAGTFGYLAPEYAATGRVTTKSDVYSFGVILMEMVTGRKVLDESQPEERTHLVPWFRRVLINKDNIRKVVDPSLDPDEETFESILKVAELAGYCTSRESYQRPDMGHMVNILSPLVELWKPSSSREDEGSNNSPHTSLSQVLRQWQTNEGTFGEGTSIMGGDPYHHRTISLDATQTSIPSKPSGFADSFDSMDGR
ncbi:hypothetical protein AAC387_Pa01g1925 [Persea americana]